MIKLLYQVNMAKLQQAQGAEPPNEAQAD